MPPRNFLGIREYTLLYPEKVGKMGIFGTFYSAVPPRNSSPYAGPAKMPQKVRYHMYRGENPREYYSLGQ